MGETRTFTLVPTPNQGLLTAWSDYSIAQFPQSYKSLRDVVIRDNSFQAIFQHTRNLLGTGQHTPIWAIYHFNTSFPITFRLLHVSSTAVVSGAGTANLLDNFSNTILTTSAPHELCFLTIKDRCFIAGLTIDSPYGPSILHSNGSTVYAWGKDGPAGELAYSGYGYTSNANIKSFFSTSGSLTTTSSSTTVTCSDASFNDSGAWTGAELTVVINSTTVEHYTISTVTNTGSLELITPVETGQANKFYLVHYGDLTWYDVPPSYSYAYYCPATAHVTNGSPVLQIAEGNQTSVNVELTNIQGTNDPLYTHIILFRSDLGGGGGQIPLRLDPSHGGTAEIETTAGDSQYLIKNNFVGTKTYIDFQPDSMRGQVIGNFQVPLNRNNPPPSDIRFTAFWNGQVFLSTVSKPWRLYYSRPTTTTELGLGEESFPPNYYTDISSDNGYITGLRPVGDSLIVATDKFLYFPEGPPNSYTLTRVSSRGGGVNHWAIDEHPGDSTANTASAIYVSRDLRLWRHFPGGQLMDIGAPIQDKLDAVKRDASRPFFVKVCAVDRYQLLALGIMNAAGTYYDFYFFDFDTQMWLDLGFSQNSGGGQHGWSIGSGLDFGTHKNTAVIGLAENDALFNVMTGSIAHNPTTSNGETHFLDMGDWSVKKQLQGIVFYCDDTTPTDWSCGVRFDRSSGPYTQLSRLDMTNSPRYMGPGIIFWDVQALSVRQWHAIQLQWFIGGGGSTVLKLHKVEIIYTTESTGISGKP